MCYTKRLHGESVCAYTKLSAHVYDSKSRIIYIIYIAIMTIWRSDEWAGGWVG